MTRPLISCIVPVYNGAPFLAEALDSIVAQTYRPIEIIVVDDGSIDGSADVAAAQAHAVRVIRQENAGPAAARNAGLRASVGAFVAFLDADDGWHPEKLTRQLRRLDEEPRVDVCVAHASSFSEGGVVSPAPRQANAEGAVPAYAMSTFFGRREAFDRVGLFNPALRHSDDTDWFLRAREAGIGLALLDEVLLFRREHAGNMSRTGRSESVDEYLQLIKRTLDRRRGVQRPDPPAEPSDR